MTNQNQPAGIVIPLSVLHPSNDLNETILHRAVKSKDIEIVKKVLDSGGQFFINRMDGKSRSPIHVAIEEQLDQILELFLSTSKEVIADNQCLIHYAIEKGTIEMVKVLATIFSLEKKNKDYMTAFCVAIKEEKFEILDILLGLRCNFDICSDIYNYQALFYVAIVGGNMEMVKKFLESNFPINDAITSSPDGWYTLNVHAGFTPLHLAVKYLRLSVVELLLTRGADISKINDANSTALHLAFETKTRGVWKTWQDIETNDKIIDAILKIKLEHSPKLTNVDGVSHLHIACSYDRPEVIANILEEKGISGEDFASCNNQGFSPLHYAAKYRCHKVAKLLLQYNIDVNQQDEEYRTPLHIASKEPSVEFVQLLMQHGADLIIKDCHGNTPIHLAFNYRNYAVLNLLMTDPTIAKSNPTNAIGISHFHIACTRNDASLVGQFIDAGVSVNLQVPAPDFKIKYTNCHRDLDWRGCEPLHFAAAFNRFKIVVLLLMNGADVHGKDAKGFSPIHVACQSSYDRFGDLIKETLQDPKNSSFVETLNKPYTDVTHVDEEIKAKTSDPYPRRFPSESSYTDILKIEDLQIIDWKANRQEQIDIVESLVRNGADLNVIDNFGNAPLYYLYDLNIHKILDALDEKLHLDKKLGTLIVRGFLREMHNRRRAFLKKMFDFGVRINMDKCYNNISILHYICQENEFWDVDRAKMVKYFLDKKADPNATDNLRLTPPQILSRDSVIERYYKTHFGINETRYHSTPLHFATRCRPEKYSLAIVNHLLEADADVNAQQTDGMTALHNMSLHCRGTWFCEEIIRSLLKCKARIDTPNVKGQTPLFLACLSKNSRLVSILLIHGADSNVKDNKGRTAFGYFCHKYPMNLEAGIPDRHVAFVTMVFLRHIYERRPLGYSFSQQEEDTARLFNSLMASGQPIHVKMEVQINRQIEKLKDTKINYKTSLFDIVFMNVHDVAKNIVFEPLEKVLYSTKSYVKTIPSYFLMVNRQFHLAAERRSLLPKAKQTLNRVLSTTSLPEVCSEFIFMLLTNNELEDFITAFAHLTEFTIDNSKIKAYQKIRRAIGKYVNLNYENEFVVDLIVRKM